LRMWGQRLGKSFFNAPKILLGGGGAALASVLLTQEQKTNDEHKWRAEYGTAVKPQDIRLSRKITSEADQTNMNLRLYQYQTCPYCCKVRAFLDFYGFSYEVVEVNPVTRSQIKFANGYKKVPILTTPLLEKPLVESSLVISILKTYLLHPKLTMPNALECYPQHEVVDPKTKKPRAIHPNKFYVMFGETLKTPEAIQNAREEREWREWVDEHFIHLISPNVYRTYSESLDTFHYFDQVVEWERNFPWWERLLAIYMGATAMFMISKRLKKRHNIGDERKSMLDACEAFLTAKGNSRTFMGGNAPNLADLALYGAINSFVGCTAFKEMREQSNIGEWYDAVHEAVVQRRGSRLIADKSAAIKKQLAT
jgi:microsomal prostaglandin-E synthase 2